MKKTLLKCASLTFALLLCSYGFSQKRTFTRDYTYRASERDSKVTARAAAIREMQTLLLLEIGQVLQSEQALRRLSVAVDGKETFSESFSQEIMAITAGFVEMKIIEEDWDGKFYYIAARMVVDPKEVSQRVAKALDDRTAAKPAQAPAQPTPAVEKKPVAAEKPAVAETPVQKATPFTPKNMLFSKGAKVYQDRKKLNESELRNLMANRGVWRSYRKSVYQSGKLLDKSEISNLMAGGKALSLPDGRVYRKGERLEAYERRYLNLQQTASLQLYNKGMLKRKIGNACNIVFGAGVVATAFIVGFVELSSNDYYNNYNNSYNSYNSYNNNYYHRSDGEAFAEGFFFGGFLAALFGTPLIVTGIVLKSNGNANIRESVNMYNNGLSYNNSSELRKKTSAELRFGVTPSGVGLALNF